MRAPRQPRKPRRLTTSPTSPRESGGELPAKKRPSIEDHVPTAPMPAPDEDVWAEESAPQDAQWHEEPYLPGEADPDGVVDAEVYEADEDADVAGEPQARSTPTPHSAPTPSRARAGLARIRDLDVGRRASQLWASTAERVRERNTRDDETIVIGNSISLDDRRAERRSEMRKIRLKRVGIGSAIIAVILFASWVLFGSPLLRYEYDPSHITGYSDPSIVNRAELESLVAQYDGHALLTLNERALENDITTAIAEIDSVVVKRDFPDAVSIQITEAVPVACLGTGDDCTAVTAAGVQLDIPPELATALPRIGAIGADLEPGAAVDNALTVLGALSPETRALVSEISVANGDLVTINLSDGRTVYWGGLERNDFKAQVLDALVSQPASHYDVSIPDAPVSR